MQWTQERFAITSLLACFWLLPLAHALLASRSGTIAEFVPWGVLSMALVLGAWWLGCTAWDWLLPSNPDIPLSIAELDAHDWTTSE